MAKGDEYVLGRIPSRDGRDYSESLPTPTWAELMRLVERINANRVSILFVGKLGSTGQIDGTAGNTTRRDIQELPFFDEDGNPLQEEALFQAFSDTNNGAFTGEYARRLLRYKLPMPHIVGIVVRKID